jgi:hypothetical protein
MASTIDKKKNESLTDNTVKKNVRPQNNNLKHFQPGQIANPAGRPKGSRNQFAEAFIKDFLADWEAAGPSAIQNCRLEDPAAYLRIAASLVPKEFNIKDGAGALNNFIDQFRTPEEVREFRRCLAVYLTQGPGQGVSQ